MRKKIKKTVKVVPGRPICPDDPKRDHCLLGDCPGHWFAIIGNRAVCKAPQPKPGHA